MYENEQLPIGCVVEAQIHQECLVFTSRTCCRWFGLQLKLTDDVCCYLVSVRNI